MARTLASTLGAQQVAKVARRWKYNGPDNEFETDHIFQLWLAPNGDYAVYAGCRGPWSIETYRRHLRSYGVGDVSLGKREATALILDYFEAVLKSLSPPKRKRPAAKKKAAKKASAKRVVKKRAR